MGPLFWILLLVAAIFAGNLLLLRPSAHEQQLMRLRTLAQARGATVLLRAAPDWLGQRPGSGLVAQYHWPLTQALKVRGRWRWHEGLGNWQPVGPQAAWREQSLLPAPPPPGWLGLEIDADRVVVFWREQADPAAVEGMESALNALRA